MPGKRRLTPQEKKRLSLQHDMRPAHGESNKGSRRTVPRRKRASAQGYRRTIKQRLADGAAAVDQRDVEQAELDVLGTRRGAFRKWAGIPLGEHLQRMQESRIRRQGRKARSRAERAQHVSLCAEVGDARVHVTRYPPGPWIVAWIPPAGDPSWPGLTFSSSTHADMPVDDGAEGLLAWALRQPWAAPPRA